MGPFGEVLLLDWGLAKVWSEEPEEIPDMPFQKDGDPSLTAQGRLQGSPLYMSPEQIAESHELDHRSDIYSLGVVLYEILAGQNMFSPDNKVSVLLDQATKVTPPRPSEVATDRDIPRELEDLCMRCIEKDPDARIQTARLLVASLRSWRLRWSAQSD